MATSTSSQIKQLLLPAFFTLLFCVAIGFNISPYFRGPAPYPPEWQWVYSFTNTLGKVWAPVGVGVLGILGLFYFDTKQRKGFLLFCVLFLLSLQLSILYFSRAGVGVLLERIINPGITGYFTTALSVHDIGIFFTTYGEHVARFPMRAADHPPFAVLFFSLLLFLSQYVSFLFPLVQKITIHHGDIARIWAGLLVYQKSAALLSALIIPILSALVVVPLYYFAKLYYDKQTAIRASLLYSVFPAVSLFLPLNDTFLGFFVMLGFLFFLLGQRKKNFLYYFLAGLSFAVGAFFSVSILVPLGMMGIVLLFSEGNRREKILEGLGVLVGLGSIPLALYIFYRFNTFAIFAKITALQANRSYLPWVFYDLYDFFIFSGVSILVFSITLMMRLLRRPHGGGREYILPIAFFSILFLLDILGFSRAETGRIWMPYMPLLAVIIANFLTKQKKFTTQMFAILMVLQLIQLLVMQEFWVTLW